MAETGFANRLVFLDRGGAGPRLSGLPTRRFPGGVTIHPLRISSASRRICDEEGAALFVSTYYTTPIATPTLMLVYDLIPERLGLDMPTCVGRSGGQSSTRAPTYASRRTPAATCSS